MRRPPAEPKPRPLGCWLRRCVLLLFGLALTLPALAADPYSFQDRGDRREGIRPKPVSGDDIELISVRAEPVRAEPVRAELVGAPAGSPPERMRLTFFLPADEPVSVTVRELDYRYMVDGYSLDTNAPVFQEVRFFHSPDLK